MSTQKNKIDAEYLRDYCGSFWPEIYVFDQIDSTNSWLKNKNSSPVVCIAETQTHGRGRNGNQWLSPDAENIYLSFNWVFEQQLQHLPLLSLWIGITIAEAVKSLGVENHGIKWPNDLYWAHKKLGGILIETSSASSEVVVGIGINVNVSVLDGVDQPWTSLNNIVGSRVDRNRFLVELLRVLRASMESFPILGVEQLKSRWAQWDLIEGKAITFEQSGKIRNGVAKGVDNLGYLLVEMDSGEIKAFNATISKVRW